MFSSGILRDRITIYTPTEAQSSRGEVTITWTFLAERWAQVTQEAGPEIAGGNQQRRATTMYKIRMRTDDDVTNRCKIVWKDRNLHIASLIVPELGITDLVCYEVE